MMKSALHKPWIDMQLPIRKLNTYLLFFLCEYPFRYYYRFITNSHFEHVVKNLSYQIRNVKTVQILRLLSAFLSLWSFRSWSSFSVWKNSSASFEVNKSVTI